jgi:hypothetical protein
MALTADVIGRPWRAEQSKKDSRRFIVRRADGVWICDFDGENARAWAELVAAAVNAFLITPMIPPSRHQVADSHDENPQLPRGPSPQREGIETYGRFALLTETSG